MRRFRLGRLALVVLLVMTSGSVVSSLLIRSIVAGQEQRILTERGRELAAALDGSFQNVSLLLPLAGAAASGGTRSLATFAQISASLVENGSSSIAATVEKGDKFDVISHLGAQPSGASISGPEAAILRSAGSQYGLVAGIVRTAAGRQLVIATSTPGGVVVVDSSRIDSATSLAPGADLDDVDLALYVSRRATPSTALLVSGGNPSGVVEREFVTVGNDSWLMLLSAKQPLIGSVAAGSPWITLLGGLIATALVVTLIEGLARRRTYALGLVAERTATLEEALKERARLQEAETFAREEAESANRYKNVFISRMSHELRTPLNAVIGFGQLLELQELSDEQREDVSHILKGGHHLLGLINELLDIARIESGDLALSQEPVLVSELIENALGLVRPFATEHAINLVGGGEISTDGYVLADRQRLQQVLLNLLSNAVKYNRVGGTVAVSCESVEPTRFRIKVSDTGIGIPKESLSRLFTPFERLGAERSQIEGTGIGLALSRQLAEAMGGTLEVETVYGEGSTFSVELALVEGQVERFNRLSPSIDHQNSSASVVRGAVVLYVEDNLANLTLVERIIAEREGVELISAMQGRLGLELAEQHRPSLILLDLHLPDIGGDEALARLRDDPLTATIPVVMVSADATPGQVQRLLNAGAASYITKPIDVGELLRLVDTHLGEAAHSLTEPGTRQ